MRSVWPSCFLRACFWSFSSCCPVCVSGFPLSLNCIVHNPCTIVKPTGKLFCRLRFLHIAPTLPLSQIATPRRCIFAQSHLDRQRGGFFLTFTAGFSIIKALSDARLQSATNDQQSVLRIESPLPSGVRAFFLDLHRRISYRTGAASPPALHKAID